MKPAQLLLAYQRLVERERELRDEIERVESLLNVNPDVVAAEEALAVARAGEQAIQLRLLDSDRDREAHRTRMRSREKELMSGRVRNPKARIVVRDEAQLLQVGFAEEEEAALRVRYETSEDARARG